MKLTNSRILIISLVAAVAIAVLTASNIYGLYLNHFLLQLIEGASSSCAPFVHPPHASVSGGFPLTWITDSYSQFCISFYTDNISYTAFSFITDVVAWFVIVSAILFAGRYIKNNLYKQ